MGVLGRGHQIGPAVYDICPPAGRVKGLEGLFAQHYFDPCGFARFDLLRLDKGSELHGGDFHSILFRVLGIRLLDIELYDLPSRPVSGIMDTYRNLIALLAKLHRHIPELEVGVGKAVSERKGDFFVVVESAPGGRPQNGVLISGLIVAVPNIDPLGVNKIPVAVLHLAVPDLVIPKICRRRGVQAVIYKRIRKSAGGIYAAADHFRDSCHAVCSECAGPKASVDPVLLQKSHFHRIFGIEHHDQLLKALPDIGEQFFLFLCQLQGFRSGRDRLTALFRFRIGGFEQICRTCSAADHDYCRLGILFHALLHAPRKGVPSPSLREIPQFFIDADLFRLQRVLQRYGRGRRFLIAVNRIHRAFPEDADHCPFAQRKHFIGVAQQNDPFSLDPFSQLRAVRPQFRDVLILRCKILRAFLSGHRVVALPQREPDRLFIV